AVWYSGWMSVFMALLSEPDGPNRCWSGLNRLDGYLLATALRVGGEADDAVHPRPQRVVLTQAHVVARVHARAALPHDDRASRNQLAVVPLYAQSLGGGLASVLRRTAGLLVSHGVPVLSCCLELRASRRPQPVRR